MKEFNNRIYCLCITALKLVYLMNYKGALYLKEFDWNAYEDIVLDFFKYGINFVIDGNANTVIEFMLECEEAKWIKDNSKTADDLFLIRMIKKFVVIIQTASIEDIQELSNCLLPARKKDLRSIFNKMYFSNITQEQYCDFVKKVDTILYSFSKK